MPEEIIAEAPSILVTDPTGVFMVLLAIVGGLFWVSEWKPLRKLFEYVPPLVFCYFLPMIATSFGIIPDDSPVYGWFLRIFLPPILLLLLLSADLKAIARLGPKAVGIMLIGTVGIIVGAILGTFLLKSQLSDDAWGVIAGIVASWTGGSVNMYAVYAAYDVPRESFGPAIVVDAVLVYSYMGILIALSQYQNWWARKRNANQALLADANKRVESAGGSGDKPISIRTLLIIVAVSFVGGYLSMQSGTWLRGVLGDWLNPVLEAAKEPDAVITLGTRLAEIMMSTFSGLTIGVLIVTTLGIILSFTPLRRMEEEGASRVGMALLYVLITTFGAQANLTKMGEAPMYAAVGGIMMLTHALFIFTAIWFLRAPLFFGAVGSQANVGGVASATIVAGAYQPKLAPVGALLGVLGSVLGTYVGIVTAQILRWILQ